MNYLKELDFYFPFFVFTYGAMVTFVLNSPILVRLAETRLPAEIQRQLFGHRFLALFCTIVGAIWSLQNLWS